jgi:RND family efflux transporter MFP subunit
MRPAAAVSSALVAILLAACGEQPAQQAAGGGGFAPPVGVASPIKRQVPVLRETTGMVEAIQSVELRPQVGGMVVSVVAKDGAEVKAGEPILEIDRAPLEVAERASEANLARTDALLIQARQQFQRAEELLPQHVVTQQQRDDLFAALKTAEAQKAAAEADLANAKLQLGYAHVASPITGRLGKIQTTVGNLLQGGGPVPATLITTVVSLDPIDIAFDVDEPTWSKVGPRVRAIASGGAPVVVTAAVGDERGFTHQGMVAYADNRIDTKTGSIRVHARFANADRALTPGAFARVRIEAEAPREVLLINEQSLQSQLAMRYVTVVKADGGTEMRPVQLGEQVEGGLRVVTGGLGADERIVVSGLVKVFFPGAPVTPMPTSMEHPAEMAAPGPGGAPAPGGKAPDAKDAKQPDAKPDEKQDAKPPQPAAPGKQPEKAAGHP